MLQLPNNCRCGKFSVSPANWKSPKADKDLTWQISYWFFDDNLGKKKRVRIMGMNRLVTLKEKQDAVKKLIEDETIQLQKQGVNLITDNYNVANVDISEHTLFTDALNYSLKNLRAERDTIIDIKSSLKYISLSIQALNYDRLPIGQVRKKHIRFILDQCGQMKDYWSDNLFNHYRKNLSILFTPLTDIDAIDLNPVQAVKKRTQLKTIRETVTEDQRKRINDFLFKNYYSFWRFLQIFFLSGAREIEMLRVKKKDVNLEKQEFKVLVKKGKQWREDLRVITKNALPYWKEIIELASDDDYLFSHKLLPGKVKNSRYQLTKRWKVHVKEKLNVTADMYSLKHLSLDETAKSLDIGDAQKMAGHLSKVVTMGYATGEKERQRNRLKDIDNKF